MAKQITDQQVDMLVEHLISRVDQANEVFLRAIGEQIKNIKNLSPSKAHQLIQILKYGTSYDDIVRKINKLNNMNIDDINKIFDSYATKDQSFYEQFYQYRNKPFIPYSKNKILKQQTKALTNIVKNEMYNFTRNNVLGYSINGQFVGLRDTYNELLDTAFLNVGQGKETFDDALFGILKQIGQSGLKTLQYESGRSVRLDSAIRMHLKGRLRELHNENQKIIGKEIDADGIEISVHQNPAPDHELVQGRQFTNSEYNKLNSGLDAKDYNGIVYTLDHDHKNGYRPISEMNCYHYIFSVVLGVNKPEYSDEQLKNIIKKNNDGFDFEGKHYTNYQGTQLQRSLERAIREQKDVHILAKSSQNEKLINKSQQNITILTNKYQKLSKVSGLPTKANRLRVSGHHTTKIEIDKTKFKQFNPQSEVDLNEIGKKYFNSESNKYLDWYVGRTSDIKRRIDVYGDIKLKQDLDKAQSYIDTLAKPSKLDFKMYSAKDIDDDYSKNIYLLSGTISKPVADIHNRIIANKKTITIYVEKGANIISTYNTTRKQFNRQGEIILPTNRKMIKLNKYEYVLKK